MTRRWRYLVSQYAALAANMLPPLIYLLIFFYIPMSILLVMSFWKSGYMTLTPAFTLENYKLFFSSPIYLRALANTVLIATGTMLALIVLSYPIAYYLARFSPRHERLLLFLIIIPVEINFLIRIFAWKIALGRNGIINSALMSLGLIDEPLQFLLYSKFAVALVLAHEWLPYVVIPLYLALKGIPQEVIDAARSLGANRWDVFWRIIVPLSVPGLFASFVLVYIPMLGEFAVPTLVGGPSGYMLGNVIESQFLSAGNWGLGSAIGFVLLTIILILVALVLKVAGLERLL
ncbi:MAG: ABC transporter permease [Chloroflexi bacterium]|nr:ABC transporter permease [Chloroflexota bacterium]